MDEKVLDILLFLKENEYSVNSDSEIIVWVSFYNINDFVTLFPISIFDEGGIDVKLQDSQIALNIKEMLEKIILEFGNKCGDDLVVLENEYYEDGICSWNMWKMIQEVFEIDDDDFVSDVYFETRENLISYKTIDDAYDNLKLKRKIKDE